MSELFETESRLFPQTGDLDGSLQDRGKYREGQDDLVASIAAHKNILSTIDELRAEGGLSIDKENQWKKVADVIKLIETVDGGARYIMSASLRTILQKRYKESGPTPEALKVFVYILLCPMEDRIAISNDANTVVLLKKFEDVIKQGIAILYDLF
jgi:hypothetical protein